MVLILNQKPYKITIKSTDACSYKLTGKPTFINWIFFPQGQLYLFFSSMRFKLTYTIFSLNNKRTNLFYKGPFLSYGWNTSEHPVFIYWVQCSHLHLKALLNSKTLLWFGSGWNHNDGNLLRCTSLRIMCSVKWNCMGHCA